MLACYHLFQCLSNLGTSLGGGYNVQPILLGGLSVRCHDLHLVTAIQFLFQLGVFAIDLCADTFTTQFAMDMESKIEYSCSFGQFEKVSFGCKYEYLILVQIHLELVHHFH